MTFYEIEFPLAGLDPQAVEDALFALGAGSITFVDRGDEPVLEPGLGEVRLWSDTLVRGLFERSVDAAQTVAGLAAVLGPLITETARVRGVEDLQWERVWLKDWTSMRFGRRLWVCPTAAAPPEDMHAVVVRLDPGLAFGTGTHPTTALCLQILDSLDLSGRTVIDYGCGSGILGIAALKLGASRVVAVDIDPQALLATRENALRNGVADRLTAHGIDVDLEPAHCVVANILAGPLLELAPRLTGACQASGHLLLSGLLKTQAPALKTAYAPGFATLRSVERDDWCCIFARRSA